MKYYKILNITIALVFIISNHISYAQKIASKIKINKITYNTLINAIRINKIENSKFEITTDKYGRVLEVASKDSTHKLIFDNVIFIATLNTNNELIPNRFTLEIENHKLKNIEIINDKNEEKLSKLSTIIYLTKFISNRDYEKATSLFSIRINKDIIKLKNDGNFQKWISAWTIDSSNLDKFSKEILNGKGWFIFENNEWKIDEH